MPANKRNPTEQARDRRLIAHLYLFEHLSQAEIAERLNQRDGVDYTISRQLVGYDLQELQKAWLQAGLLDLTEAKVKELARIDELERAYWLEWAKTLADRTTQTQHKTQRGDKELDETVTIITHGGGDPRYLEGVRWCIERRCKLLGLDEPTAIANLGPSDLDEYEQRRRARLTQVLAALGPEWASATAGPETENDAAA
jgi:hypothetical protein